MKIRFFPHIARISHADIKFVDLVAQRFAYCPFFGTVIALQLICDARAIALNGKHGSAPRSRRALDRLTSESGNHVCVAVELFAHPALSSRSEAASSCDCDQRADFAQPVR